MLKKLKIPLIAGLTFYGIAFGTVKLLGFNSESFMIISYLYVLLAFILGLKYELSHGTSLRSMLDKVVVVVEDEETVLKSLFTGEKYRLEGEVEKLSSSS